MARERSDCHLSVQEAAGHRIVRLKSKGMPAPVFPPSKHAVAAKASEAAKAPEPTPAAVSAPAPAPAPAAPPARPAPRRGSRVRRVAVDLLPPVVTRAIRKARAARS